MQSPTDHHSILHNWRTHKPQHSLIDIWQQNKIFTQNKLITTRSLNVNWLDVQWSARAAANDCKPWLSILAVVRNAFLVLLTILSRAATQCIIFSECGSGIILSGRHHPNRQQQEAKQSNPNPPLSAHFHSRLLVRPHTLSPIILTFKARAPRSRRLLFGPKKCSCYLYTLYKSLFIIIKTICVVVWPMWTQSILVNLHEISSNHSHSWLICVSRQCISHRYANSTIWPCYEVPHFEVSNKKRTLGKANKGVQYVCTKCHQKAVWHSWRVS